MAFALIATVALGLGVAERPPAWRALQSVPGLEGRGKLHGAPPCLRGLRKLGWGHTAKWRVAQYSGPSSMAMDIDFALDRNPDEACCKLLYRESESGRRVGYMLLVAERNAS